MSPRVCDVVTAIGPIVLVGAVLSAFFSCRPTAAQLDTGIVVTSNVCALVEATDPSGDVKTICATVDEIGQLISFLAPLIPDGGPKRPAGCHPMGPVCPTDAELAAGIDFLLDGRRARAFRDAGSQ